MNKIISCTPYAGGWRVEVETPSGARSVGVYYGSKPHALEQASWNTAEPEPA